MTQTLALEKTNGKYSRNGIGKTLDRLRRRSPSDGREREREGITLGFCRQETLIDGRNCRERGKIKSGRREEMDFASQRREG